MFKTFDVLVLFNSIANIKSPIISEIVISLNDMDLKLEGAKEQLAIATVDEQIAIAQSVLGQLDLTNRYVEVNFLDTATPLVRDVVAFFEGTNDKSRLGLAATITSTVFRALIGQVQQESPTNEFQKQYLVKMLSAQADKLLRETPFSGIEAEVQLLDSFLRGFWTEWQSSGRDVSRFGHSDVFWHFVLHHDIGNDENRDRLANYLQTV